MEPSEVDFPKEGWRAKPFRWRLSMVVLLWIIYSTLIASTLYYAHTRGKFENVTSAPPSLDVIPEQFIVTIHAIVYFMQFLFVVGFAVTTLAPIQTNQSPVPVALMFAFALLIEIAQLFAIDYDILIADCILSLINFVLLVFCTVIVLKYSLNVNSRLYNLFVINPLAVYSSFFYLTVMFSVTALLKKTLPSESYPVVKISMIAIVFCSLLFFATIDNLLFYKYTQTVIAYYMPLIGATVSMNLIHFDLSNVFDCLVFATGLLSILVLLVKLIRRIIVSIKSRRAKRAKKRHQVDNRAYVPNHVESNEIEPEAEQKNGTGSRTNENFEDDDQCTRF